MPCVSGCGACCEEIFLSAPKRVLLERAAHQADAARFRAWVKRLIPVGAGDPAETLRRNTYRYACPHYDRATTSCLAYDARPNVCRDFPFYGAAPSLAAAARLPARCGYVGDSLVEVAIGG